MLPPQFFEAARDHAAKRWDQLDADPNSPRPGINYLGRSKVHGMCFPSFFRMRTTRVPRQPRFA